MSAAPPDSSGVDPGTVIIEKYRLDRVIGAGGMATVFAATHLQLGEAVAVKVLQRHMLDGSGAITRFLREARVAMRLKSEHVARVLDAGTMDDGTPFIVMELLQGADLASLLAGRGRLPIDVAVDYLLQACQGLAEAHAAGVVHRDLKPANLFLCKSFDGSPCVKVLDFGVSKLLSADSVPNGFGVTASGLASSHQTDAAAVAPPDPQSEAVTLTQALLGSPQYMAPEQLRSARDVDIRTDIWALGVILYELVSGHRPFAGHTLLELSKNIVGSDVPQLNVPDRSRPEVQAAIERCLAKDPSRRYADVREFAEAVAHLGSSDARTSLERIVRMTELRRVAQEPNESVRLPPAGARTPGRSTTESTRRARWTLALTLGGAAAAAAAVILPRLGRGPTSGPEPLDVASEASVESVPSAPPARSPPSSEPRLAVSYSVASEGGAPARNESSTASPARVRAPSPSAPNRPSAPASAAASTGPKPDPALHLDTGGLFMDRK